MGEFMKKVETLRGFDHIYGRICERCDPIAPASHGRPV